MLYELYLDIDKSEYGFTDTENPIVLRQQDEVAYEIFAHIREDGKVLDLTGYEVWFHCEKPDGSIVDQRVDISSAIDGTILYPISKELTDTVGSYQQAYFRVLDNGTYSASTENIPITVSRGVYVDLTNGDYIPDLDRAIARLDAMSASYDSREEVRIANEIERVDNEAIREANELERQEAERLRKLEAADYVTRADFARLENKIDELGGYTLTLLGGTFLMIGNTLFISPDYAEYSDDELVISQGASWQNDLLTIQN